MKNAKVTRRRFLAGATGSAVAWRAMSARAAATTTIGFIYVGSRRDFGWNQSHAIAAAALKEILRSQDR